MLVHDILAIATIVVGLGAGCTEPTAAGGRDCVAPAGSFYVLRGTGTRFEAFNEQVLVAVTSTDANGERCVASADVMVAGGAFAVEIENAWDEFSVYPRFGAFFDANSNSRCDDGEAVWTSVRILIDRTATGELRGDSAGRCADL